MPEFGILRTAAALILLTACGSSPSGDPKSAAMFVGTWTAQLGTTEVDTCGSATPKTTILVGTVQISLVSPGSGSIYTLAQNGCKLTWTCNGTVATLAGTQQCGTYPASGGGSWTPSFTGGTLTLGTNLIDLQDRGSGILNLDGANQSCSFSQNGSFKNN